MVWCCSVHYLSVTIWSTPFIIFVEYKIGRLPSTAIVPINVLYVVIIFIFL